MPLIFDYPSSTYQSTVKPNLVLDSSKVTSNVSVTQIQPPSTVASDGIEPGPPPKPRQASQSELARSIVLSKINVTVHPSSMSTPVPSIEDRLGEAMLRPPPKSVVGRALADELRSEGGLKPPHSLPSQDGVGLALSDTPISSAPGSPQM